MNKARNFLPFADAQFKPQKCAFGRCGKIRTSAVVDQKSPSKGKLAIERISGVTINIFVVSFYYACLN